MKNIKVNYKIIKALDPCQDGLDNYKRYFGRKNTTILDILESPYIQAKDKIWLAVRAMDKHLVDTFAVDCAYAATAYGNAAAEAYYASATYVADAIYAALMAYHASANAAERENQVDSLIWLLKNS